MPEILINCSLLLVGLVILMLSSDWLIQGSVKFAFLLKLTPLFVGLVLIAFGTSAPEAGVGITAALRNQKGIALGNIIGSNIANIGLILGLCALVRPLGVERSIVKRELPIMIAASFLLYALSLDLSLSRLDGAIFIVCFIAFCIISYRGTKKSFDSSEIDNFKFRKLFRKINSRFAIFGLVLLSLAGIVLGADLMVRGGSSLARIFGISPWIIGITIFAIGTSLPELAASLTASIRKVPSISVGNVVGSNIFNILLVLGIVTLIKPIDLNPSILRFELSVLLVFSVILFAVMRTNYKVTRREGALMFLGYLTFLFLLIAAN